VCGCRWDVVTVLFPSINHPGKAEQTIEKGARSFVQLGAPPCTLLYAPLHDVWAIDGREDFSSTA
jgi:hypothetical protein